MALNATKIKKIKATGQSVIELHNNNPIVSAELDIMPSLSMLLIMFASAFQASKPHSISQI